MDADGDHAEPAVRPSSDDGPTPPVDELPPDASLALPELIRPPATGRALGTRIVLGSLGVLCLVLGVVGWLIPVVTGVPFYLLGLVLLGAAVPAFGRRINAWERRLPRRWRLLLRPKLRRAEKQRARAGGTGSAE